MKKGKQTSAMRAPLKDEELRRLLPSELAKFKLTDDEMAQLREINRNVEKQRVARLAILKREEEPILADLRQIGCDVRSVWDLVNSSARHTKAIPILLKHLTLPYSDKTREGIARALAVREPEVQRAWPILVQEYRKAPEGLGIVAPHDTVELPLRSKHGLACALAATVTDDTLEELIDLAHTPANGESRLLLLPALRKSKNPLAKRALEQLASDPLFKREIAAWRRK